MTVRARLRFIWTALNKPVLGTKPRRAVEVKTVDGHIPKKALSIVQIALAASLAVGMLSDMVGWISWPKLNPFKRYIDWAMAVACDPGWGGFSKGMWAIVLSLGGMVLIPALLMGVCSWVSGSRLVRRQTNLPVHGKPWFPLTLIGGPAAVRRGRWMQVSGCVLVLYVVWAVLGPFGDLAASFLVPPSALQRCGTH